MLKVPTKPNETYYIPSLRNESISTWDDLYYNPNLSVSAWASTSKSQAEAFSKALQVMGELRKQEGIVVPNSCGGYAYIGYSVGETGVEIFNTVFESVLSPAYANSHYANKAIDIVGKERIIEAISILSFLTPESRGE